MQKLQFSTLAFRIVALLVSLSRYAWLRPPGGRGGHPPRLPQNAACGFPALRSSEIASQRGDSWQLRIREIQLWSQQWKPLFDPMELLPPNLALPAPAAQHAAPDALHGPMDLLQCAE